MQKVFDGVVDFISLHFLVLFARLCVICLIAAVVCSDLRTAQGLKSLRRSSSCFASQNRRKAIPFIALSNQSISDRFGQITS